jgi:hypothetical protein
MEVAKPEYYAAYRKAQQMKQTGAGYPYWKPEVAIKYLIDEESYPLDFAHVSGMVCVKVVLFGGAVFVIECLFRCIILC